MRSKEQDRERKRKERKLRSHHHIDRKHYLKKTYKLTPEGYEELYRKANGKCQICGCVQEDLTKHLGIDHDHSTGLIRGLLCPMCNQGLGMFRDRIDLLEKAKEYLEHSRL